MTGKKRVRSTTVPGDSKVKEDPPEKKARVIKKDLANLEGKKIICKESLSASKRSYSTNRKGDRANTLPDNEKKLAISKAKSVQEKTPRSRMKPEIKPPAAEEEKSKYFLDKGTKQNCSSKHVGKTLKPKLSDGDRKRSNPKRSATSMRRGAIKLETPECGNKETAVKMSKIKSQLKEEKHVPGVKNTGEGTKKCSLKGRSNGKTGAKKVKLETAKNSQRTAAKVCQPTSTLTDSSQGSKKAGEKVPESTGKYVKKEESDSTDESDDSADWEEVEELPRVEESPEKVQIPKEPIVVTLEAPPALGHKKKERQFDFATYLKRQLNRADKELQENMHKTHLLCLLSHGFHRNRLCNRRMLQAVGLSLIPHEMTESLPVFWDIPFLKKFVSWFSSSFHIKANLKEANETLARTLMERFRTGNTASEAEMVYICIIMLRSLGADVRLVFSLNAVSHKPPSKLTVLPEKWRKVLERQGFKVPDNLEEMLGDSTQTMPNKSSHSENTAGKAEDAGIGKSSKTPSTARPKNSKPRSCASKVKVQEVVTLSDESDEDIIEIPSEGSATKCKRTKQGEAKQHLSSKRSKSVKEKNIGKTKEDSHWSEDSDFEIGEIKLRKSPAVQKKGRGTGRRRGDKQKVVSSDSDDVQVTKIVDTETGSNIWLEVYLERLERWVCMDCVRVRVNSPAEMEQHASKPMRYVLAYDNHHGIKDVTQRYASGWMSQTRRLRIDEPWWEAVLVPFKPRNKIRDETETLSFQAQHMRKPLPTVIGEYKSHPFYALKRHLLKFEAIYPESAVPVGYIKGEPVYSRDCVHELHTRETWVREGRAVRVKEKPYKLVKARKKRNAKTFESGSEEKMAEVFGRWQTEQYMPPPAYNGKVPRNEYGNVEVFKPWMIPAGSVHLQIPGLNKVARKLNIDCAPAMTGWDFHGGYNHPILDGFIVCEEFKDVLLAAWDEQQEIDKEREREKREKRALSNWKLLTKSLVIKERLKKRFDLQDQPTPSAGTSGDQAMKQKADDVTQSWPLNRQTEKSGANPVARVGHVSLFPSEEL